MRDLEMILSKMEGWCTLHKAQKLQELAAAPGCQLAVEIGIFGGKSLIPVAMAFAKKGSGKIYGIEPWDNDVAIETVTNDVNDQWWKDLDLVAIKRSFLQHLVDLGLEKYVKIIEVPSDAAVPVFQNPRFAGKIDLVHIDGAHSVEQSLFDCTYWHRLLRSGGYIVLDDINWPTLQLAFDYLKQTTELIYQSRSEEAGHFAIFRKF